MYVLTGATGHVGGAVARLLLDKAQDVCALVRDEKKAQPLAKLGAKLAIGHIDDLALVTKLCQGADGVFVLIPPNSDTDSETISFYAYQQHIANTLASAVKDSGIKHVVLLSSIGADVPAGTGPIRGLHFAEKALKNSGAILSAVRAGMFQENVLAMLDIAQQGVYPCLYQSADTQIPMVATRDVAVVVADLLLHPPTENTVVEVQGPAYSVNDLANVLGRVLKKPLKVVMVPPDQREAALRQSGVSAEMSRLYAEMTGAFESGLIKSTASRIDHGKTTIEETLSILKLSDERTSKPATA